MKTTEKDILLICKGYYSDKYKDVEDALNAYYVREYGDFFGGQKLPYAFMNRLWMIPCFNEFIKYSTGWFSYTMMNEGSSDDFDSVMFHRMVNWLHDMRVRDGDTVFIDLSDYDRNEDIV